MKLRKVIASYPQWQVHITVHSAQAVMSVVSSECLRNGGPDEKLELKNTKVLKLFVMQASVAFAFKHVLALFLLKMLLAEVMP